MKYNYHIINVFSNKGITGGNQLAVIPDAFHMRNDEMQFIAKQFNFSETTFVVGEDENIYDIRIFTPQKEIPYAGHPIVGTISILEFLREKKTGKQRDTIYLNLKVGRIKGTIARDKNTILPKVSFTQLLSKNVGNYKKREKLLRLLNLKDADLAKEANLCINSVPGTQFLFVQVKSLKSLKAIAPQFSDLKAHEFKKDDLNVYAFTTTGDGEGSIRGRFFAPLYGINEDPATGSAQSPLGLCLLNSGMLKNNTNNRIVVEQGYEMGRPCKIYNRFTVEKGELTMVETAGNSFYFSEGQLNLV